MKIAATIPGKDKNVLLGELKSKYNLSFSSHLILGRKLIALDGLSKKLMISEIDNEWVPPNIIELNKVAVVSVKKTYGSIRPGELTNKIFEEFLERVDLKFEYNDDNKTIVILPFYNSETDEVTDIPRLERNAKNLQMILSKMLVSESEKVMKMHNELSMA